MSDYTWMIAIGFAVIAALSALAANAESTLWRKSKRNDASRRTQQLITLGKSHCR